MAGGESGRLVNTAYENYSLVSNSHTQHELCDAETNLNPDPISRLGQKDAGRDFRPDRKELLTQVSVKALTRKLSLTSFALRDSANICRAVGSSRSRAPTALVFGAEGGDLDGGGRTPCGTAG
jgi:hypothetical protein